MNLKQVARMIPADYRDMILEENVIYKAIAVQNDKHMFMLFTVWKNYCNPFATDLKPDCTKCLGEILTNFKTLEPILVQQRLDDQIINA